MPRAARADEYAALIAEHYERAGEAEQAAEWHERAGRQAQAAYANKEALAHYEQALAGLPEARHAGVLLALGQVQQLTGEWNVSEARYLAALTLARAVDDGAMQGRCQQVLGELSWRRGDYAAAREWLEQARASAVACGDGGAEAKALYALGNVAHEQSDYSQAQALFEESLALRRTLGDRLGIASALAVLVALTVATSQIERAARLAGSLDALLRALRAVLDSPLHRLYDTALSAARAQLDAATFEACWAEGQAMTWEQAVAYALGEDEAPPNVPSRQSSQCYGLGRARSDRVVPVAQAQFRYNGPHELSAHPPHLSGQSAGLTCPPRPSRRLQQPARPGPRPRG